MRSSDRNNQLLPAKIPNQEAKSSASERGRRGESARGRHKFRGSLESNHRKGMCPAPLGSPHRSHSVLCMVFSPRITVPRRLEEETLLLIRGFPFPLALLKSLLCPDTPRCSKGPSEPQISDRRKFRNKGQTTNGRISCWHGAEHGELALGLSRDGPRRPLTAPLGGTTMSSYHLRSERGILAREVADVLGEKEQPHLVSIGEMKNSLKKDLEKHQTYLTDLELRLAGLERRAEDVTKHLEQANLELKALKLGSATLKNLVDQETFGPAGRDQEAWEPSMGDPKEPNCHRPTWNKNLIIPPEQKPGNQPAPEARRPGHKADKAFPTMGAPRGQEEVQMCLSQCQVQIEVLIRRVNKQIHQIEGKVSGKKPCLGLKSREI
ncbi:uncharacterized protein LOC100491517 isoform X3 [Xenopus tropicalis]|uniref:Uncharacterized protein LOC100491517 isoform X3 n=2 Tax=Xenopus tropicalis TaxID=8364 RepID=A0A1B8Y6L1_XENTR|nr:uncharacterized protein LOC100491517 isoform X3 [Xenopus tropicalis]|eukprot:XP_017945159.1 PREDICTED: uncharacterized protein LOC100491517 isoform X3 [Xenopus tropicalis]